MRYFGIEALITVLSHIFFICATFWSLQALRTDTWIKKYHIPQARLLYVFLSIAIGYNVSSFFIDLMVNSQNLVHLFG